MRRIRWRVSRRIPSHLVMGWLFLMMLFDNFLDHNLFHHDFLMNLFLMDALLLPTSLSKAAYFGVGTIASAAADHEDKDQWYDGRCT